MTTDEIVEAAIQGHASTRDAIRWAIKQEREICARIADQSICAAQASNEISARGEK